jgi:hypothetical protein
VGSEDLAWYLDVGGRATRRSGTVSEIGRCGEGDEADWWGPHGSDVRERRCKTHFLQE